MNVNTLGNLQQNIVSTDLIERLERFDVEYVNEEVGCRHFYIEDLETIEQLEQALISIAKVEKVNSTSGLAEVRALGRFARTERERIRKL